MQRILFLEDLTFHSFYHLLHLQKLAAQHTKTRFLKASVENVPFLVTKLEIKVLPCVIAFVDGVAKDKLIGFEEIGNTDSFATATLEWRLGTAGK